MNRLVYFSFFIVLLGLSSCSIFKKKSNPSTTVKTKNKAGKRALLEKYTKLIGEDVSDEKLYGFIDEWTGTPYKFGGKTKAGVDCSNFSCQLLREVYEFPPNFYFPTSKLTDQGKKIDKAAAREGDLVLFSINQSSKVSHVGVYLANEKFVHASTSKGVMINSLNEDYYKKRFAFILRLKK
jgi:lipoprotein Spr